MIVFNSCFLIAALGVLVVGARLMVLLWLFSLLLFFFFSSLLFLAESFTLLANFFSRLFLLLSSRVAAAAGKVVAFVAAARHLCEVRSPVAGDVFVAAAWLLGGLGSTFNVVAPARGAE